MSSAAMPTTTYEAEPMIDALYDAALEPAKWSDVARELSSICGGAAIGIALHLGDLRRAHFASFNLVEISDYEQRRSALSLPFEAPNSDHDAGFAFMADLQPPVSIESSDFFDALMRPLGLAPEAPLVHILETQEGRPVSAIGVCRTSTSAPLDARVLERCNALVPHLARSYRVIRELREMRDGRLALTEAIDRFPTGVILIDARRRRVISNQCADRTLAMLDGLTLVDDRPSAHRADEDRALREAIGEAIAQASSEDEPEPRIVSLSRPSGETPLQLMISPLREVSGGLDDSHPVAVIFVPEPGSTHVETEVLKKLYSLTNSEAAFITAFVAARSIQEAASLRGIQTSTARGYLKSAFQKTGTNTQHGLMHLLLTGVGRIRSS